MGNTHISASVCCTLTCCPVWSSAGTWCNRRCGTWSSPLRWLYADAKKRTGEFPRRRKSWKIPKTHSAGYLNVTYINLHLSVEAIVEQKVVGHADSVGFHGVTLAIVIIPHVTWNKIKHIFFNMDAHETFKNQLKLLCNTNDLDI